MANQAVREISQYSGVDDPPEPQTIRGLERCALPFRLSTDRPPESLAEAILAGQVSSLDPRTPGAVVRRLPKETRDSLSGLTSDAAGSQRTQPKPKRRGRFNR